MRNDYSTIQMWGAGFICCMIGLMIGFGAGKMSHPALEEVKQTSSLNSSDTTTASSSEKKSEDTEQSKSTFKAKTYYPNGQLKSEVENSVEMLKTHYESEITELKIQIKMLQSSQSFERVVKYSQPQHQLTGGGGLKAQKLLLYQHQWLLPNLFLGGGVLHQQDENIGLVTASFQF